MQTIIASGLLWGASFSDSRSGTAVEDGDHFSSGLRTLSISLFAALLVPFGANARADAQALDRTLRYGVVVGPALPIGAYAEDFDPGRHAAAILGLRRYDWPLGLRVDASYHRNNVKNADFHQRLWIITGNLEYRFRGSETVVPYAVAGAGRVFGKLVDDRADFDGDSEAAATWNIGVGIAIPVASFEMLIEARHHAVELGGQRMNLLPISVGFVF
jgi:hypothetical protein